MNQLPILYSFRRCPYAMRARLALATAAIPVELREVLLRDKPDALRQASPKATVPVLVLADGEVIDESLDIMHWALEQRDPEGWLAATTRNPTLLASNDGDFKHWLDRYKYADRHPEQSASFYRQQGEAFLQQLEGILQNSAWLGGTSAGLEDAAVFPFIRQFAGVEPHWFATAPYPGLRRWLQGWLDSALFESVMHKYPPWQSGAPGVTFP